MFTKCAGSTARQQGEKQIMKVEINTKSNGKYVVYLVQGDLLVAKGIFTNKVKAKKEAKRVSDLYGCEIEN